MIITTVEADGLMSQLGEEIIEDYDPGSKAVGEIVNDLLAFQRKATKITRGTITVEGYRKLKITTRSILDALLQLQSGIGGYMFVDNDRQFHWLTDIGEDKGQQIRYRKNLTGITREEDYSNCCTKLHLVSGGEKLSDITRTKVTVDKDSDASYGYLILKEKYAAYYGWTGEGNALPANVHVYEKGAELETVWVLPTKNYDPEGDWFSESNMYDNNTTTYGGCLDGAPLPQYATTDPLYLMVTSFPGAGTIQACGFRIRMSNIIAPGILVRIYVSPNGSDYTYVAGLSLGAADNNVWKEVEFSERTVWDAKITVMNYAAARQYFIHEFHFMTKVLEEFEVTGDFEQGENERTLRCDIGDYDPAAPYTVTYQHANYLVAWDKIIDDDDFIAKAVHNKYEVYALSVLESATFLLDEMKEPLITYSIKGIDLSQNIDFPLDFDALELGSIITVIDEDLGIDVSVRVVSLRHPDLLNPHNIELELSTKVKDISDYLVGLHKQFS